MSRSTNVALACGHTLQSSPSRSARVIESSKNSYSIVCRLLFDTRDTRRHVAAQRPARTSLDYLPAQTLSRAKYLSACIEYFFYLPVAHTIVSPLEIMTKKHSFVTVYCYSLQSHGSLYALFALCDCTMSMLCTTSVSYKRCDEQREISGRIQTVSGAGYCCVLLDRLFRSQRTVFPPQPVKLTMPTAYEIFIYVMHC